MRRRASSGSGAPGPGTAARAALVLAALALSPGPGEGQSRRPASAAAADADTTDALRLGTPEVRGGAVGAAPTARPDRGGPWARWAERAAGLATLVASDVAVRRTALDFRRDTPEASVPADLSALGNDLGTWKKTAPFLAGGALAGGALLDGVRGAGRGASLLAGVLAGSMASEALNRMVGRGRPSWGRGPFSLRPFSGHASFPSGHAAYLFSVAGGVDALTDGWLPAAAAYGVAGVSAYGRLYSDKHWLSDVVVAAVLSSTVSRAATRRAMRILGVGGSDGGGDGAGDVRGETARTGPDVSLLATPSRLGVRIRF